MKAKRIDLHTHTHCSDGKLSPYELVEKARDIGLAAIAVTDHDTTNGVMEAVEAGEQLGVEVLPGVEISALYPSGTLHILGYDLEIETSFLQQRLQDFVDARNKRNPEILQKLSDLGYTLEMEEVKALAGGYVINRPHIARAMLNRGYVSSIQEAFDRFLAYGGPAYAPKEVFTPEESIEIIHRAGGVAVLAHPDQLKAKSLADTVKEMEHFIELGIDGIEAYHGECSSENAQAYDQFARNHDLLITGGSDYHGDTKHRDLGEIDGCSFIPYEYLEAIKEKKSSQSLA